MAKKGETRKKMMLLNSQGLSGVPPARGEKGKKTGIKKNSEMEMFHFSDLSNMRIQNFIMEQDHLRMNVAPVINNHLRSIEPLVSVIYH